MEKKKKKSLGKRLMHGVMWCLGQLPLRWHYALTRVIVWVMRDVIHYRRDEITINIARSFPDKKYDEVKAIARQFYARFGDIFAEAIWFGGCTGERGARRLHRQHLVEITNTAELNDMVEHSSSIMVLNSHQGNWELQGGLASFNYDPDHALGITHKEVVVVYMTLHNALWNSVIGDMRCAPVAHLGYEGYVESGQILRYAISHRREKKLYFFNTDQYPYGAAARCDVGEFLHQRTEAMIGGAQLACKLKMRVVYLRWEIVRRGCYRLTFQPLFENAEDHTPEEIMTEYYRQLEKDIQAQPWNYLWSHKRWK